MSKTERITIEGVLSPLRDLGWTPGAILDIGVATGTKGLYSIWPEVDICLVEPSPKSLVYMRQIAERYPKVHIYNVGASDHTGEARALVHDQVLNVIFRKPKPGWEQTTLKVMTCDDIVRDAGLKGPFLYKLDTDSHEREVLAGSSATLDETEVCIVEANVFNGFRRRFTPDDMWRTMYEKGFSLFDIASAGYGPGGLLRTLDLVFMRTGSELFERAYRASLKGDGIIEKRVKQQIKALHHNPTIE